MKTVQKQNKSEIPVKLSDPIEISSGSLKESPVEHLKSSSPDLIRPPKLNRVRYDKPTQS